MVIGKISLWLIFCIIIIGLSQALSIQENYTTPNNGGSQNGQFYDGYRLYANNNATINNITKATGTTTTECVITDCSNNDLKHVNFAGNLCSINYNITQGNCYYILVGNKGSSWNIYYNSSTSLRNNTLFSTVNGYFRGYYSTSKIENNTGAIIGSNEHHGIDSVFVTLLEGVVSPTINYTLNTTQLPDDINSTTDGNLYINASATIQGTTFTGSDSATLFYKPYTALNANCAIFYQTECKATNSYKSQAMTKINNSLFTIGLDDDQYIPGYYPFNAHDLEDTPHSNYTAFQGNSIKWTIYNFSVNSTDFFITLEFDAVNKSSSTASLLIYYCNSSYSTGNPLLSSNCVIVDSFFPVNMFQHVHNQSGFNVIPITIRNVTKTQLSSIVFVSPNLLSVNGWNFGYITNASYNNASFNNGNFNAWSNTSFIYDMHLHAFLGSDYFTYYAQLTDNGTITTSSTIYDFYNITNFAPSAPLLLSPCDSAFTVADGYTTAVFYNWTPSFDINGDSFNYTLYYDGVNTYSTQNTSVTLGLTGYGPGTLSTYIIVCDQFGACDTSASCSFTFCKSNYVRQIQPCVSGARYVNYTDSNSCSVYGLNLPADTGTYEACNSSIFPDKSSSPDIVIIIFLVFLIIVSMICGIAVAPIFFAMTAFMFALLSGTFIYYAYPPVLYYACWVMVLLFVVMAVIIKKDK